jgi:hypothetical protein
MSIDSILYDRLKDAAGGLDDIVGTRIYPARAEQNAALPYVVWEVIDKVVDGRAMGSDPAIRRARIQIDGFETTYSLARALEDAIRARVQRWRTSGPPVVFDTYLIDTSGPYQDETASGPADVYRVTLQIELCFEES